VSPTSPLSLLILSPEDILLERDNLTAVNVPLADGGAIGIRSGHAPLIAETLRGTILYRTEGEQSSIELLPGVLQIRENKVVILTAGQADQGQEPMFQPQKIKFDRLMKTLVSKFKSENESA